ncbi:hypothetical protein C8R45DRAFT_949295 [Mycena sanguinolenta]|nr:hypothetical protein C8R45DRAFT_949295 [Mycena sanguinolenta]
MCHAGPGLRSRSHSFLLQPPCLCVSCLAMRLTLAEVFSGAFSELCNNRKKGCLIRPSVTTRGPVVVWDFCNARFQPDLLIRATFR